MKYSTRYPLRNISYWNTVSKIKYPSFLYPILCPTWLFWVVSANVTPILSWIFKTASLLCSFSFTSQGYLLSVFSSGTSSRRQTNSPKVLWCFFMSGSNNRPNRGCALSAAWFMLSIIPESILSQSKAKIETLPTQMIQTEAERRRRKAGIIQWIERGLRSCLYACMFVCFSRISRD